MTATPALAFVVGIGCFTALTAWLVTTNYFDLKNPPSA